MTERGGRVWAVVPVKRLCLAKQRLSSLLGPGGDEFARQLARQTVLTLRAAPSVAGVLVVTADPQVAADATAIGAIVVDDHGAPLNAAYTLGIDAARQRAAAICALVPADLARLTPEGFDSIVAHYAARRAALGPRIVGLVRCKDGTGTNLVLFDAADDFRPAFGTDSFARHLRDLGSRGVELPAGDAAFDIDTIDDLRQFALTGGAGEDGLGLLARAAVSA